MKAKRLIAVVMAFLLIFGNAFSVNAVGIIGEMVTDISGLNRLTISAALNDYFASREAFLLNQSDTINALFADTADEIAHKEKYTSENIVFVDSAISIGDVIAGDIYADVDVTETVTYLKDGVTNTANIAHKLLLGLNADNEPTVVYDGYYEAFSGFRSCSYVDETNAVSTNSVGGSGSCIVHTAEGELGYTEGTNGYTKYGDWYKDGYENSNWCVMFVSWCAAEANISESIIMKEAYQIYMQDFFIDQGRYHSRTAAVGEWAPATGDLVFFADNRVEASHVGIVERVDDTYIYVIHGNNSQGQVASMEVRRTNDWILGYAKPAYASSGHTNKSSRDFNTTQHWFSCANCGLEGAREAHTIKTFHDYDNKEHWFGCVGCSYAVTKEPHSLTYVSLINQHKGSCDTCGYIGPWEAHQTGDYEVSATHHWKVCNSCNIQVDKEKHMFDEVLYGRVYMCVDCAYESDSPNDAGIDVEVE